MMLIKTIALTMLGWWNCAAWGVIARDNKSLTKSILPSKGTTSTSAKTNDISGLDVTIDSIEILLSKRTNLDIFSAALSQIQSLKKSNSCHRTAARVYLNSCQYLEEFAVSDPSSHPSHDEDRAMDYMYSYALSLSMCDLGAARQRAPISCQHFHEAALSSLPSRDSTQSLHVSHQEIHDCMEDLYSDMNFWTSFTNNKGQATLFCQLARLDMEQDLAVERLGRSLEAVSRIMDGFESQLKQSKIELAKQQEVTKSYFNGLSNNLEQLKDDISRSLSSSQEGLVQFAKDIRGTFTSFGNQVGDCKKALASLTQTIFDTHAEHASAHAQVVENANDLAVNIRRSNSEITEFQYNIDILSANVVNLANGLAILHQRQNTMDAQSSFTLQLMENITEQLRTVAELGDGHTLVLAQAKRTASDLLADIEEAKSTTSTFASTSIQSSISWASLVGFPCVAVVLGSYGLEPSLTRNLGLATAGLMVSVILTYGPGGVTYLWESYPYNLRNEAPLSPDMAMPAPGHEFSEETPVIVSQTDMSSTPVLQVLAKKLGG